MADDLRDQLTEALEGVTEADVVARGRFAVVPSPAAFTALVDAVLTVVGPELERLRDGVTLREAQIQQTGSQMAKLMREAHEANERAEQTEATIERARALHQPMQQGGLTICAHCSAWNGTRCRGEVKPHPCPTLAALDIPTEETPS